MVTMVTIPRQGKAKRRAMEMADGDDDRRTFVFLGSLRGSWCLAWVFLVDDARQMGASWPQERTPVTRSSVLSHTGDGDREGESAAGRAREAATEGRGTHRREGEGGQKRDMRKVCRVERARD